MEVLYMDREMEKEFCVEVCDVMDIQAEKAGCLATGYQDVNVCIPVTIKPFGEVGNAKTRCQGSPVVIAGSCSCMGNTGNVCMFTISQKLRVEVPVIFGARAEVGDAVVDCKDADVCRDCGC
jgi:hypothetical protein